MAVATTNQWPATSIADAYRILTAPGAPFEMDELVVGARRVRVYKRAFASLRAVFEQSIRWKDREYLVFESERLTFDAHYCAVAALSRKLVAEYGVRKGDRVAIAMRNYPEWSIAFWASACIGAVVTPLNAWGTADDLRFGVVDSGSKVVFADAERMERLGGVRSRLGEAALIVTRTPRAERKGSPGLEDLIGPVNAYRDIADRSLPDVSIDPDDDATIFYTSGTTGRPKGAQGTHRNIVTNILNVEFAAAFRSVRRGEEPQADNPFHGSGLPQKTGLLPAPFFHVTGCHSTLVPAMARGRKVVLMYKWNAERALELIERERINTTSGVPSMAWQMLESPDFARRDLSSIEGVSYGGAAAAPELALRVARAFPRVFPRQAYGATETSSVATANSGEDYLRKPNSVGLTVPVCDIRIVRDNGALATTGESGEIWISGPSVVSGYWNNADATRTAFVEGWYRTGDIGRVDDEGFVYVLDRIKDMLIRGGENIYCAEVEAALFTHPAVLDAAVIGVPHRVLGEEVGAVIQQNPGHAVDADGLRSHVARLLASHKVPRTIEIRTEELPKNASGKVLKRVLRDELLKSLDVRNL